MDNGTTTNSGGGQRTPAGDLGPEVNARIEELRGKLDDALDEAARFVRTRPGTSLLIAIGAGYLVGRIVRS